MRENIHNFEVLDPIVVQDEVNHFPQMGFHILRRIFKVGSEGELFVGEISTLAFPGQRCWLKAFKFNAGADDFPLVRKNDHADQRICNLCFF